MLDTLQQEERVVKEYEFHEVASIFPLMSEEEHAGLVEDIQLHGLREAIWLYKGKIIDGRNRYRACKELGIEPQYREWEKQGYLASFVVKNNEHKLEGLSVSQRSMIAARVARFISLENEVNKKIRRQTKARLRNETPDPGPQEDCYICRKFKPITQAHHICPIAEYLNDIKRPYLQQTRWLCPNCHEILHRFRKGNKYPGYWDLAECLTPEEWERVGELMSLEGEISKAICLEVREIR